MQSLDERAAEIEETIDELKQDRAQRCDSHRRWLHDANMREIRLKSKLKDTRRAIAATSETKSP